MATNKLKTRNINKDKLNSDLNAFRDNNSDEDTPYSSKFSSSRVDNDYKDQKNNAKSNSGKFNVA